MNIKFLIILIISVSLTQLVSAETEQSNARDFNLHNNKNNTSNKLVYSSEINHYNDNDFAGSKMKDISTNSGPFFEKLTGTPSPNSKDLKTLSAYGQSIIDEQEKEDRYKPFQSIESDAQSSAKIMNHGFNRPMPYGFVRPSTYENPDLRYQSYYGPEANPHNHDTTEIYYGGATPERYHSHFEALNQAKEDALRANNYQQNNNYNVQHYPSYNQENPINHHAPHFEALTQPEEHTRNSNNYRHSKPQGHSHSIKHYPSHTQHNPAPHPNYYSNEQQPHVENFNDGKYYENNSNQQKKSPKKNKKNHGNYYSEQSYNSNENKEPVSNVEEIVHKGVRHQNYETPIKSVLLNHRIYHNDDYNREIQDENFRPAENNKQNGSYEDEENNRPVVTHTYYGQNPGKANKPKKGKKSKNNHNRAKNQHHGHNQYHGNHNQHGHHGKPHYADHPNQGQSYQVIEFPQESKISEKLMKPVGSNHTTKLDKTKLYIHVNESKPSRDHNKSAKQHVISKSNISQPLTNKITKGDKVANIGKNLTDHENINKGDLEKYDYDSDDDDSDEDDTDSNEKDAAAKAMSKEIRYFQDIYLAKNSPHEIEFGHVMETPERVEERFEDNDRENNRFRGKVEWENKNGEKGQQLWDLNHPGK